MKKIIFSIFLILVGISNVNAKDTILTCEYYKPFDQLSGVQQAGVLCEIYNDYSHQCYMEVGSNKASHSSNKEKIQNWGATVGNNWKVRDYVKEKNKCPDYLLLRYENGAIFNIGGYDIYAADDMNRLVELQQKLPGKRYQASLTTIPVSDELKKKAEENVKSYIDTINSIRNSYSINTCKENSNTITRYQKCQEIISNLKSNIETWNTNVYNYINEGYLDEEDTITKLYRETVRVNESFLANAEQEIAKENEKIQSEMGIPSESESGGSTQSTPQREAGVGFDELCTQQGVKNSIRFIGYLLLIVKIIVPILLIVLGTVDFAKATIASDADAIQKAAKTLATRAIAGIVIFIIPTIVNFVFKTIVNEDTGYDECRVCIFEPGKCDN